MRLLVCLSLLLAGGTCKAWDTPPHQKITKAAIESLPARFAQRLGGETQSLVELYCIYPDRYQEMTEFGFVRKSAGPQSADEIAVYCVRPDGEAVHGATGEWESDAASLVFLFERILTSLAANRKQEAARFAGVLSHFIADSLSPPHAVSPDELLRMAPEGVNAHAAIERSIPEFSLKGRAPRLTSAHLLPAARGIFDQLYAGAAANRKDLPAIVAAEANRDEATLDAYRLRSGRRAAEILADALFTLYTMAEIR